MPSEQESPDPVDVAARLRRTAGERPDHLALIAHDQRITYGELHARVDAATGALQARGVGPGDRVAIVLGTTPTFVEAAAAILRAGAVMVPLLPGLAPDELRFALADGRSGGPGLHVGDHRAAAWRDAQPRQPRGQPGSDPGRPVPGHRR
jgi:long-chain acyl-CoA synthetase